MKEGWEYKKLGDLCQVLDSQRKPVTKKDRTKGIYPYYGATGIQDYVDSYIFDGRFLLVGEDGAKWGASDKTAYIIEGKSWVNNHAHILKVLENVNDRLLEYYLTFKDLSEYITGAVVPKLTQKALVSIPIPIPPLSEQQHIVEELDLLSSIIEKKKAQIKELDNLAQSLFYEMFGDPITNEKGWSYKKLNTLIDENVITYHLDGNHGGEYPRSEEFVDEGVPYIGANSLNNGFVNFSMAKYLPKERAAKLKKGLAINGDVLFAHNATVGPVAYLITNEPLVILSTSLTAYRCNQDKMNPLFLRAYMQSIWFESQYKASMKQTTRNQIPITQQKKFDFILPPISLQNQFAEKIKVIEHQKELINQSIKEVETLFNSRMDYYFN